MHPITLFWHDPDDDVHGRATVDRSPAVLGRAAEADVPLPFGFVSSRHARLVHDGETWWIEDLGSTNGVFHGGQMIERMRMQDRGEIRLGRLRLRWESAALSDATVMAQELATSGDDDSLRRLRVLLDLQQGFEAGFSGATALGAVLDAVLEISGAERACILLREDDTIRFAAGRAAEIGPVEAENFRASLTVVDRVLTSGEALFQIEGADEVALDSASISEQNLRALAGVPLHDPQSDALRGVLYADSTRSMHRLQGLDREVLVRLAGETEAILARIELRRVTEEKKRQEQELAFARHTQQQLLPRSMPTLRGWGFAGHCVPSREVGGDFYDVVRRDDTSVLAVVADVSGKGVAASLLAASAQAAIPIALQSDRDPGRALARVNDFLHDRSDEGRFVTAFVGLAEVDGTLTWMSAGHNPACLWRADTGAVEQLGLSGIALAALESSIFDGSYEARTTRLGPGDLLFVYSDGVTEAEDPAGGQYGEERLLSQIREHARDGAHALRDAVLEDVARFTRGAPAVDDLTILVLERTL